MILFRVQFSSDDGQDWTVSWRGTSAAALALLGQFPEKRGWADRVEVPTDKTGLVEALDAAQNNRGAIPHGNEEIGVTARVKRERKR